jgi:hypothetical protein
MLQIIAVLLSDKLTAAAIARSEKTADPKVKQVCVTADKLHRVLSSNIGLAKCSHPTHVRR